MLLKAEYFRPLCDLIVKSQRGLTLALKAAQNSANSEFEDINLMVRYIFLPMFSRVNAEAIALCDSINFVL
ncbi:hypothetical protein KUL49_00870 [Alteromonas sp. KUL49]|nr:hypothetical protein KUL49_00870 [Alteromonas sp. KUL49]